MQVIRQRVWTEAQLKAGGFHYFQRRKQLVMAGRLPVSAAPLRIEYDFEHGYAQAGDVIIYEPGSEVHSHWKKYHFWSVKPDIFKATYRPWNEPDWTPTATERDLMRYNCRPYYKAQGAWARQLKTPVFVQSLEHPDPIKVPVGFWVLIGDKGDPWSMSDDDFRKRYLVPAVVG